MLIDGARILLTGASGGIGAAIAMRLAAGGAQMLLIGRRADALDQVVATLAGAGHIAVAADIATLDGRRMLADAVNQLPKRLDVLINCAGVNQFKLLADASAADVEATLRTNLLTPILLTQQCLPQLNPNSGRVINIGSTFGGLGYPGYVSYCASKFGLRGFTEALRRELVDSDIQVGYLAPRGTRTPLNDRVVCEMNAALGNVMDPPERVAAVVESMLRAKRMRDRAIGWPERFFLRLNALAPALVDAALRNQMPTIRPYIERARRAVSSVAAPTHP